MEENGYDQIINEMIGLFDVYQEYYLGIQYGQCQVKQCLLSLFFVQFFINEKSLEVGFFVNY